MHYSGVTGEYYDSRFQRHFAEVEAMRVYRAQKLMGYWSDKSCTAEELTMMLDSLGEYGMDLPEEYGVFNADGVWLVSLDHPAPVKEVTVEEVEYAYGVKAVRTTIRRTDESGTERRTMERYVPRFLR
jgi:hypothetical protein